MERAVLLRIKNLQQSGCRVSLIVRTHFVYLIEHKHRIRRTAFLEAVDDTSRQRTYIRTPVAPYLRLVMKAA